MGGRRVKQDEVIAIVAAFIAKHSKYDHMICGSFRRGKDDMGDIDLVLFIPKNKMLSFSLEIQEKYGVPWAYKKKGILWQGVQLEVHICGIEDYWGAMIMYATGSGGYNAGLRRVAAEMGYKLNRYGLWAGGIRIAGRTEKSIYEALGKRFINPEDRR